MFRFRQQSSSRPRSAAAASRLPRCWRHSWRQIERHNPALNAVVILDTEAARERAGAADAATRRGEHWGPLHGVPFTLKDTHSTAGMRSTVGFPPFAGHVARMDSPVVARLRKAGGILVGKTNAAMLLADYQTDNPLFGTTNNPWDLATHAGRLERRRRGGPCRGDDAVRDRHRHGGFDPHSGAFLRRVRAEADRAPGVAGRRISQSGRCAAQHPHHELHRPDGAQRRRSGAPLQHHCRARRRRYRRGAGAGRCGAGARGERAAHRLCRHFSRHSGGRRDTRCRRGPGADAGPRRGDGRRDRAARDRLRRRTGGAPAS